MKTAHICVKSQRRPVFSVEAATLTILLASLHLTSLFAQTSATTSLQPVGRYLFAVETSRAMQARASGVFNALKQALDSGLNGQIRQGDTVGIWTFNENVYQGLFPSQKWSQATQLAFAVRLPALQEPETYQKRARLEKLLPEMLKVISGSEAITVVLMTSGEGTMRGTPFDEQINAAWKEWHDEQEGVQMPLVTVLRARLDEITDWSFTPAPRTIELPAVVANLKAVEGTNGLAKDPSTPHEVEKRAQSSKWGPEQQVAFSVWALGRTGTVATLPASTNETRAASQKGDASRESAKEAAVPASGVSAESSRIGTSENQASNVTISFVAPHEAPAKLVFKATEPSEEHKQETARASQVPGQAQTQPIPSPERSSGPSAPDQSSPLSDASLGASMVAHARAADPAQENRGAQGLALAAPRRGFLRENINPLVLMIVAAFGAGYCFRNWFLTGARPAGTTMSLTRVSKED